MANSDPRDVDFPWHRYEVGGGVVEAANGGLRFVTRDARAGRYADAQVDDYRDLPRRRFAWRPPLTMQVRARFSHGAGDLKGTAGFGFWNDPFAMTGARVPALPRALWFFYASPQSDMALAMGVPGRGWKAATIDATRLPALAMAPLAPLAVPLMNVKGVYRRFWPVAQNALAIAESSLAGVEMTAWHDYRLAWLPEGVRFEVDGEVVLETARAPRGPLGFVMWLDNQYAVVTPWGRFGWGTVDAPGEQWMAVEGFSIAR